MSRILLLDRDRQIPQIGPLKLMEKEVICRYLEFLYSLYFIVSIVARYKVSWQPENWMFVSAIVRSHLDLGQMDIKTALMEGFRSCVI